MSTAMDHMTEAERLGWLGLVLGRGVSPRRARELAERVGGPARLLRANSSVLKGLGLSDEAVAGFNGAFERAETELALVQKQGATVLTWADPAYPERLRQIADPPLVLFVRGRLTDDQPMVAMVGSRRASGYGRRVAADLAEGLASAGVTVVSGLALGIDAAAHRGALQGGGPTIAVMGAGLDQIYPTNHVALAAEIAATGALVTEFPCGTPPLPRHFPQRNRIISGLALGTIVVEAAERSGSLITARLALEQGREVFAVPGPIGVAGHVGPHRLIQQGAKLVTSVTEVLEEIAPQLVSRVAARKQAQAEATLSPTERTLWAALGDEGLVVDDVIRSTGTTPGEALETLLALELRGVIEQQPGMRFRRKAA